MAHTRTVTGTIHQPTGEPWEGFEVTFLLSPSATTTHATLPQSSATATTDANGQFSIDLESGVSYNVSLTGAFITNGRSVLYPIGTTFTIVVPDGTTPISLEVIRASEITPPSDPTLVDFVADHLGSIASVGSLGHVMPGTTVTVTATGALEITTAVQADIDSRALQTDLTAHTGDTGNPHSVTADQAGAYTTTETDQAITTALVPYETTTELDTRDTDNRDRANHTGTQPASTISDFATVADARIANAAGDTVADLVGGKVPSSQVPAMALVDVHEVASEAAQLALTAQEGDVAIRSDERKTYMHNGGSAGTMADWTLLDTPTDAVTSVNGEIGVVVLGKADVGLDQVDNTSDADKPVSDATQTALDAKAADADLTAHVEDVANPHEVTAAQAGAIALPATDGVWYQVLRRGESDPVWVDPAGVVVPTLLAMPGGSYDRDGAITVDASASVEVRDGAWWVCEGTTNLVTTPLNLSQIIAYGSVSDIAVSSDHPLVDTVTASKRAMPASSSDGLDAVQYGLDNATTYTFSAWVKYAGTVQFGLSRYVTVTTSDGAWVRPKTTVTGETAARFISRPTTHVPGAYLYLAAPQAEAKDHATPFVVGTRVDGVLTIPCATRPGTILVRASDAGYAVTLDEDDAGTLGTRATVAWDGADLIITATYLDIEVQGVAVYTDALTTDVADGLLAMPGPWSFGGMIPASVPDPLPATIAGYWPTNATIATGGTTLRTAPGASTQAITTLTAGTAVHDTGTRLSASSVLYAYIMTSVGQGYVPASTLIS